MVSGSVSQTRSLGVKIGRTLRRGDVVALIGDLGVGKTTLAKGIAQGLGVRERDRVASPTFVLIHEYEGHEKIYHIDWYRLDRVVGADAAMACECFGSDAVTLVEWADHGEALLPEARLTIKLRHKDSHSRVVEFLPEGKRFEELFNRLWLRRGKMV